MTKNDVIRKLTSRKLWMAVALFVSGVLTAIGKETVAETVAGLIMQAAAVIGYIIGEGLVDASNKPAGAADPVPDAGPDISLTWDQYQNDKGQITFIANEPDEPDEPEETAND